MSSISVLFKRGSLFNFKFPLQDTLLISGPNAGGGLMLLPAARWPFKSTGKILDSISTTGIYFADGKLIRSLQHNEYACLIEYGSYKNPKLTISEKACDVHDVLVRGEETVIVSTGSNEIVRFDSQGEVSTVFKAEGEGDAWHLNCLDVWNGKLVVSAFGKTPDHRGWVGNTEGKGFVMEVETGRTLVENLSTPHSPRLINGYKFICEANKSNAMVLNGSGPAKTLQFNGRLTRGMATGESHIYIGLSAFRGSDCVAGCETAAVAIVDRQTLNVVAIQPIPFPEIYDIIRLPAGSY